MTSPDRDCLLAAYDRQLRTEAETPSARSVARLGPLRLVTFAGGRGFVTYQDLGGGDSAEIRELVADALRRFDEEPEITEIEWKTRAHDRAPDLHESLLAAGFEAQEPESIMIGPLTALAVEVTLPEGFSLRRVTTAADIRAMSAMADMVFDGRVSDQRADAILARAARGDGMELWVAETAGQMICAGRLEPVPGTEFVGIWGGATVANWRGRGIYRALTAARARSALANGYTLVHSDSTEFSRPILERAGLIKVSETTPYVWRRGS